MNVDVKLFIDKNIKKIINKYLNNKKEIDILQDKKKNINGNCSRFIQST